MAGLIWGIADALPVAVDSTRRRDDPVLEAGSSVDREAPQEDFFDAFGCEPVNPTASAACISQKPTVTLAKPVESISPM